MARISVAFSNGGAITSANVNVVAAAAAGTTGNLVTNCVDQLTGNPITGVNFYCNQARTADSSGRAQPAGGGAEEQLLRDINQDGQYVDGDSETPADTAEYGFTGLTPGQTCVVAVALCTVYTGQQDLSVSVNGSVIDASFSSTDNTSGAMVVTGTITVPGSGNVDIVVTTTGRFIFLNGAEIRDYSHSNSVTGPIGLAESIHEAIAMVDGSPRVGQLGLAESVHEAIPFAGRLTDYFDGTGPLIGYDTRRASELPNVARVGGQWQSGTISAPDIAVWFNNDIGRADFRTIEIPASGSEKIVVQNMGLGPASDPTQNLVDDGNDGCFAGLLIHDEDESGPQYEFVVLSHRIGIATSTLECKRTTRTGPGTGSSTVRDEGDNAVGVGITKADIQCEVFADGHLEWSFKPVGGATWTQIQAATGNPGRVVAGQLNWSSNTLKVSLIAYSFSSVGTPFVGHADAIVLESELSNQVGSIAQTESIHEAQALINGSPRAGQLGLAESIHEAIDFSSVVSGVIGLTESVHEATAITGQLAQVGQIGLAESINEATPISTGPRIGLIGITESIHEAIAVVVPEPPEEPVVTVDSFRIRFPQFESQSDARIELMISDAAKQVGESYWGDLYNQGVSYLAAHLLATEMQAFGGSGSINGGAHALASRRVGDVSVSFAVSNQDHQSSFYNSTIYGQKYLTLLKSLGMGAVAVNPLWPA